MKRQRTAQIGRHDATREPHWYRYGHGLERQEVAQTAERLANLAADLRLAKEPTKSLSGWPSKLPEQIAPEPLRCQLHATKAGVRLWYIH
jgi:hypothetical protein